MNKNSPKTIRTKRVIAVDEDEVRRRLSILESLVLKALFKKQNELKKGHMPELERPA